MSGNKSLNDEPQQTKAPQNTVIENNAGQVPKADKMTDKVMTVEEMMAAGSAIGETLVAANQMPTVMVKKYRAEIYNAFKGIDTKIVDMGIVAYFIVNDPSPQTNWGLAPDINIGGTVVKATRIVGGVVPIANGDGILRKFLSTAYESKVADVIKYVPGVANVLQARVAKFGLVGADPAIGVSWVKGLTTTTSSSSAARAIIRERATRGGIKVADHVMASGDVVTSAAEKRGGSNQEYF